MIQRINHRDECTAKKIIELQKLFYHMEANLIGFYDIPPLKETLSSLLICNEVFYGCFLGDMLIGLISYTCDNDCLDICRVAVHPEHFRKGIAENLLRFAEAENTEVSKIIVSTARDNLPAVKLYQKMGFQIESTKVVADSLTIVSLAKIR